MSIRYLLFVGICLGIARHVCAVDLTLVPGETSDAVIDATIRKIRTKCILAEDYYFLRRLAAAQMNSIARTTGGIWRVTYTQLENVQNACKGTLKADCSKVQTEFNVDVSTLKMSDLQKPLYSGLIMSLFILNLQTPIPVSKLDQALYQTLYISSNVFIDSVFLHSANKLEMRNDCANAQIDLVFVIDSSGSVKLHNFEKTKTFLNNIVTNLDIGPDKTRVAVIRFSDEPDIPFGLGTYNTKTAVINAINDIQYINGNTFTHLALDTARNSVFTTTRESIASKVLVLVTDGKSEDERKTVAAAKELKEDGVTIFTIGVVKPLVSELIASASEPSCTHFIKLKDYDKIGFIVKEIVTDSCKAPTVVENETPLVNITIPKTNETKQQVLQITNTAKSTLGTTVLVHVQCGVVTVHASFNNIYPNEADYDFETLATDNQPGKLFLVPKSEHDKLFLTVLSQKRSDLNSSACNNPSYDISINPTAPRTEAVCFAKPVDSLSTAKQLDPACYDTTPVVGEVSQLFNNSILKNGQMQEQVLEISNSTHPSGSTILVSAQCAEVTVYGAFNNRYPIEDDHDYKTSATDGNPGEISIAVKDSQTDNLTLTIFSMTLNGLESPACDHPSYTVSIKPKDLSLEVVCHRKQDERHCTPEESESKCSKEGSFEDDEVNSYASAAGREKREDIDISDLKFGKSEIAMKRNGWEVKLTPPTEVMQNIERKTVIYTTVFKKDGRVLVAAESEIEKLLAPLRSVITFKNRGVRFATVEVRYNTIKNAVDNAVKKLENCKWMLLPTYMGKRVAKVRVNDIPPEIEPRWIIEAALANKSDNVTVLGATRIRETDWRGQSVEFLVQASMEELEEIAEVVSIGERKLRVRVEGRRPRYFNCRTLEHIKAFCPSIVTIRDMEAEEDMEKMQESKSTQSVEDKNKERKGTKTERNNECGTERKGHQRGIS